MPSGSHESISTSLLIRLRAGNREAWERLMTLYSPLVYHWCRQANLSPANAADVMQEVFRAVATRLDLFRRDRPEDTFRGWLAVITRNKIRDHFRREVTQPVAQGGNDFHRALERLPDPHDDSSLDSPSRGGGEMRGVLRRAVELVQPEFEPKTWSAFWLTAVDGRLPADVAADLEISVNAVYKAKSRVLRRLRDELEGLEY